MCIKNVSSICVIHINSNCELIENWIEQVNNFSQDFYNGNILYKANQSSVSLNTERVHFSKIKPLKAWVSMKNAKWEKSRIGCWN